MIVQLEGVGFNNKGAELMAHAVFQEITNTYENGIVALGVNIGNYHQRIQVGFHHLLEKDFKKFPPLRPMLNTFARLIPETFRRSNHIVNSAEIHAVLDASGYAYSDHWPTATEAKAERITKWKRDGKKVILLPQAFGPFDNPRVRSAATRIISSCDLIFPRDTESYDYLVDLNGPDPKIRIAPDFTNLVKGNTPNYFNAVSPQPCIIPNYQMIAKTQEGVRDSYIEFLLKTVRYLFNENCEPFLLIHQATTDEELAKKLQAEIKCPLKIIFEPNALYIKGILGNCSAVISSRFHGLVSALSQSVPSLGTGWSHKYRLLFEDYSCPECLVSPLDPDEIIFEKINLLIDSSNRAEIVERLTLAGKEQKKLAANMWTEVHKVLQQ